MTHVNTTFGKLEPGPAPEFEIITILLVVIGFFIIHKYTKAPKILTGYEI